MRLAIQFAATVLVISVVLSGGQSVAQNDSGWKKSSPSNRYGGAGDADASTPNSTEAGPTAAPNAAVTPNQTTPIPGHKRPRTRPSRAPA
jgi:hypothetical protein